LASNEIIDEWREHYTSLSLPLEIIPGDRCLDCQGYCIELGSPSAGGITDGTLGSLQLEEVICGSADTHRTHSTIRQSDPDLVTVWEQIRGNGLLVQNDREATLTPGDFVLLDTSRPYSLRFDNHVTVFFLMIPRNRIESLSGLDAFVARAIRGGEGLGSVVSPLLSGLHQSLANTELSIPASFEGAVLDLVSATLGGHAEHPHNAPAAAILCNAKSFIDAQLADPALDTAMVAAAQHISVRYLQMLFKSEEDTVAGCIRRRRLERCRRDLEDPRRSRDSIGVISARHGLVDQSHFSRTFRKVYGVSPSEFRHHNGQFT